MVCQHPACQMPPHSLPACRRHKACRLGIKGRRPRRGSGGDTPSNTRRLAVGQCFFASFSTRKKASVYRPALLVVLLCAGRPPAISYMQVGCPARLPIDYYWLRPATTSYNKIVGRWEAWGGGQLYWGGRPVEAVATGCISVKFLEEWW